MKKEIDRQKLADKIKRRFLSALAHKRSIGLYDKWQEYQDFWEGEHWPSSTPDTELLPRPVTNHFAAIIERKISALLSDTPEIFFVPKDGHPEQMLADEAAKALSAMAKYQSQNLGDNDEDVTLEELLEEGLRSAALFGTAIWYFAWDNTIIRGVPGVSAYVGDIVGKEIHPAQFYPGNPDDPGIQTQPWIIVAERRNLQDVKHFYREFVGDEVDELRPEAEAQDEAYIYDPNRNGNIQDESEQVTVLHYWWKEWDDETGEKVLYYAVECQGRLLRYEEKFYQHGLYPFVVFRWYPRKKSFWGKPESADLIDNQKQINRIDAIMLWAGYTTGMPHIRYKRQFVDPRDISNDPGALIEDNAPLGAWAVDYMQPPTMPAYPAAIRDRMAAEMKDVSGVHDAWAGKAPSAQLNASAIIALQEAAGIAIKGIQKRLYRALREIGKLWLAFWLEFCTEARLVRITMPDNQEEIRWFRGADYRDMRFDVHVKAGVSSPYSRALYVSNLDKLLSAGIITPEEYLEFMPQDVFPHAQQILQRRRQRQMQEQAAEAMTQMLQQGLNPQAGAQPIQPELFTKPIEQFAEGGEEGG